MEASFDSEEYVGYWLFYAQRCVAYAFAEVLREHCRTLQKSYEITPPQWGLLSLLYECAEMTIGAISQRRGIDPPTVTGIVRRLEQYGLVERHHDRKDRRVVNVRLTAEGSVFTSSFFSSAQVFNAKVLCGFSQKEQQLFLQQLQQIVANLSAVAEGVGDRFGLLPDSINPASMQDEQAHDMEDMHE